MRGSDSILRHTFSFKNATFLLRIKLSPLVYDENDDRKRNFLKTHQSVFFLKTIPQRIRVTTPSPKKETKQTKKKRNPEVFDNVTSNESTLALLWVLLAFYILKGLSL